MQEIKLSIDYQAVAAERQIKIDYLEAELKKAQREAYKWETKYQALMDELESGKYKKTKTKEEIAGEKELKAKERAERLLLGCTSQGKKLASSSDAIGSYTDFKRVYDWLKNEPRKTGALRNATIWVVGCCLGVRVSDIVRLKFYHFFDKDGNWRERIPVVEKKTSKLNNALITDAIKEAMEEYIKGDFPDGYDLTDWVFPGKMRTEHITEKALYKHLTLAQSELGISEHIGTHSMRKTFVRVIECTFDPAYNEKTLSVIQTLLNHESITTTSRYLGVMKAQCDGARKAVSDFVQGKWAADVLETPRNVSNNELYDLIQEVRNEILNEVKQTSENK